jgi:hypothetical protein
MSAVPLQVQPSPQNNGWSSAQLGNYNHMSLFLHVNTHLPILAVLLQDPPTPTTKMD